MAVPPPRSRSARNMNDLRDYMDVLVRRWKLVAAMAVLAALAAAVVSFTVKPVFEAKATIALSPATLSVPTANQVPPYYLMVDSPRQLPVAYTPSYYIALVQSVQVAEGGQPAGPVAVSSSSGDKSLIEIISRGESPQIAAQVANAWAEAGAARIQQVLTPDGADVKSARLNLDAAEQALVKFSLENQLGDYNLAKLRTVSLSTAKQLELATLLRERDNAESVYNDVARDWARSTILATNAYKPTTIKAAVPASPVSPKLLQNVAFGAGLGLLIGILAAFAVEYATRKA